MNKITKAIKLFKSVIQPTIAEKYQPYATQVISLFADRKIEKTKEAEKLLMQLSSRGLAPQSAIKQITEKYSKKESVIGKLSRPTPSKIKTFFVSGIIKTIDIYKNKMKNTGTIKEKIYQLPDEPFVIPIKAKNRAEAEEKYHAKAGEHFISTRSGEDSNVNKSTKFTGATIGSVSSERSFTATSENSQFMKGASNVEYSFIPADTSLLKNEGFCVLDQFIGIYGPMIKHLTNEHFIKMCYQVRGEVQPEKKKISELDIGIEGIDDDSDEEAWNIKDGVSPEMLKKICEIEDISHYCFDITRKCFSKYVSIHRNYPALIYYCVNNHMYWISDKETADSLSKKARDMETKIKSQCIKEEVQEQKKSIYTDEERPILDDISIDDLNNHTIATIIYAKSNLNEELDQIIEKYNYIPEIRNHLYKTIQINYKKDGRDIILVIDPNIEHGMTYKQVRAFCIKPKINVEFKNQSFSNLIIELKKRKFDDKVPRHQPTKEERKKIFEDAGSCCASCEKAIKPNQKFDIDHIIPLGDGGTNDPENLQVLCVPCHFAKTHEEHQQGYVKLSKTESSFNSVVKEIFNSTLNNKYAFVETIKNEIPTKLQNNKIHFFDKVRCRKSVMYHNQYDYPLFTVIDEPVFYKGIKKAGLYFVETTCYVPMRGNGWYSQPMIEYCLQAGLIKETNITHAIYASLSVPKNYFNEFIDFLYTEMDDKAKLSVNSMIGCFKPKERENWRSLLITKNPNTAYAHFLDKNGCFIDTRHIGDETYYQVFDRYYSNREETEAPIYNQILEQEAIEVHKLMALIESKGGVVLDLSTDCVSCVFKTDNSPFDTIKIGDNNYIYGHYDDAEQKEFKYRKEDKEGRLQIERMAKTTRPEYYYHKIKQFNIVPDNDDFKYLVDLILDSGKSFHIDGRAGCGKTYLMKMLQNEMIQREIKYKSLAPTNKACRLINGETMHKFASMATGTFIRETDIKYIFIDEVSMMPEMFYKFFIVLKRMRPDIKFIIAGDFAQLLPVKDRIVNCNYKESQALHELCDGNRLQLTKCRRSDSTLFNMLLPENINKIKKTSFKNKTTLINICFTNKKRIEINKIKMDEEIRRKKCKALVLEALDYDPNSQDVRLCAGMPIISRRNNRDLGIYNNETFTIKEIRRNDDVIIIFDEDREHPIPIVEFTKMFNVAYCITTHRAQGATFDEPYTIYEWELFDERLRYVALSRATDANLINII